jgi:hypothetical protein
MWETLPEKLVLLTEGIMSDADICVGAYNKIKHGPQLCFASMAEVAARRGYVEGPATFPLFYDKVNARVLHDGARLQETEEEAAHSKEPAPFLVPDGANAAAWHENMLFLSASAAELAVYLYNSAWRGTSRELNLMDTALRAIFERGNPEPTLQQWIRSAGVALGKSLPHGRDASKSAPKR